MPLHPSAQVLVDLMAGSGMGITPDSTPEGARARWRVPSPSGAFPKHEVYAVDDRTVPGPAGEIPVRVFRPSAGPGLPVIMWLHGGGWVTGSLDTHDQLCRQLCDDAGAIVVSVDYRLAPETKFPGAVDDSVAAWKWITANAVSLGGDPGASRSPATGRAAISRPWSRWLRGPSISSRPCSSSSCTR